jgi:hypothetical protein
MRSQILFICSIVLINADALCFCQRDHFFKHGNVLCRKEKADFFLPGEAFSVCTTVLDATVVGMDTFTIVYNGGSSTATPVAHGGLVHDTDVTRLEYANGQVMITTTIVDENFASQHSEIEIDEMVAVTILQNIGEIRQSSRHLIHYHGLPRKGDDIQARPNLRRLQPGLISNDSLTPAEKSTRLVPSPPSPTTRTVSYPDWKILEWLDELPTGMAYFIWVVLAAIVLITGFCCVLFSVLPLIYRLESFRAHRAEQLAIARACAKMDVFTNENLTQCFGSNWYNLYIDGTLPLEAIKFDDGLLRVERNRKRYERMMEVRGKPRSEWPPPPPQAQIEYCNVEFGEHNSSFGTDSDDDDSSM